MSKFKVGDRVVRVDMDLTCINDRKAREAFRNGDVLTVKGFEWSCLVLEEIDGAYLKSAFKLVEDTTKHHKHHDLIIAWAKGAVIQYYNSSLGWKDVDNNSPVWSTRDSYRIKPQGNSKQKEIEAIETEMRQLADRLNKIKES